MSKRRDALRDCVWVFAIIGIALLAIFLVWPIAVRDWAEVMKYWNVK